MNFHNFSSVFLGKSKENQKIFSLRIKQQKMLKQTFLLVACLVRAPWNNIFPRLEKNFLHNRRNSGERNFFPSFFFFFLLQPESSDFTPSSEATRSRTNRESTVFKQILCKFKVAFASENMEISRCVFAYAETEVNDDDKERKASQTFRIQFSELNKFRQKDMIMFVFIISRVSFI